MRFAHLFGWGIVIYSIMIFTWNLLTVYGLGGSPLGRIISLIALLIVTTAAARSLGFDVWKDILPFSISWALMMAVLDLIFAGPVLGAGVYASPELWVNYTLVVLLPLLAPLSHAPRHEGA